MSDDDPAPKAATYTHGHHESVLRSHRWRTVENSAAYLIPHLRAGIDLLDVGCGPGTITAELAGRVAPGSVVGIDASAAVIDAARNDHPNSGALFAVGDAYALDRLPASVDIVHAHQVLQHLADPVGALQEWRRVCRPGGVIAARDSDYAAMFWYPHEPAIDRWLDLYRAMARANGGEPDAGRRLLAWAHAAGARDVTATSSVWCFATADERQWWAGLWADRLTASALGEQLVASGRSSRAELDELATGWHRWAADRSAWFAVPHGEIIWRADQP